MLLGGMDLVCYTPLPPAPTGVAEYADRLLEELACPSDGSPRWRVTAATPNHGVATPARRDRSYRRVAPSDAPADAVHLYQLGNSPHHDFMYPRLRRQPGIVVLHDLVLHHARLNHYLHTDEVQAYREDLGNPSKRQLALAVLDDYRDEVEANYPDRGEALSEIAVKMGGGRLFYDYPLFEAVARASRGVLVHSETARRELKRRCPDIASERIRLGVAPPTFVDRDTARERLAMDFAPNTKMLASFGLITPEKQIATVLGALERLHRAGQKTHYFLVGATVSHYDVVEDARSRGLADFVHVTGRVDDERFWLHAFAADLCLNLRYPSAGETSATLIGLLARGRAVVVTREAIGFDLPDDVALRASLDGAEDGLYCDLSDWLDAPARLRRLERRAFDFASSEHSIASMAADYRNAVAQMAHPG